MKKHSTSLRIASVMLVLALALSCTVCGTMAKYTSSTYGTDSATVAKWVFTVNEDSFTGPSENPLSQTDAFNLFATAAALKNADVATADDAVSVGYIAPGTGGSFQLDVANGSQVDATYTFELSETTDGTTAANTANIPIQYSLDNVTWYDDFTQINADLTDLYIARETGETSHTIYWRWCFEGTENGAHAGQTDVADTALGVAAAGSNVPNITVYVKLTATQVDNIPAQNP